MMWFNGCIILRQRPFSLQVCGIILIQFAISFQGRTVRCVLKHIKETCDVDKIIITAYGWKKNDTQRRTEIQSACENQSRCYLKYLKLFVLSGNILEHLITGEVKIPNAFHHMREKDGFYLTYFK